MTKIWLSFGEEVITGMFFCEKDFEVDAMPSLSAENFIRRIVRKILPLSAKFAIKHMDKDMFKTLYTTYIRTRNTVYITSMFTTLREE